MPSGKKLLYLTTKIFYQLCDDKTIIVRPGKNEQVLNKNKVIRRIRHTSSQLCGARAIVGDKSDNLDGVKGLGLKTVAKRFPFLSENKDYGLDDILTHAKNNKNKIKAYQNVAENEEIIALNYEIMQLYISTISPQGVNKLKYAIQNDGVNLNRSEIRKMLLRMVSVLLILMN